MVELRHYQSDAIQQARTRLAFGKKRLLMNAPTGAGKTVIAAGLVQLAVAKGKRVLFLAHRRELITQTVAKLVDAGVINFGVIMAGASLHNAHAPVQVASIQTLIRREFPPADLIILDECHRANSRSYLSVLANYPEVPVLGLSATPERLDGKGLDDIFEELIVVETVPNLIAAGFLVSPICYGGTVPDLSGVRIKRGDYDESQVANAMDKPKLIGDIVTNWLRLAQGKLTAVFAASVEHAKHIAQEFLQAGIMAAVVTGDTPTAERDAIIADWRAGFITVVVNVFVFVEGFDFPALECVVLARPTKSVSLYLQAVGRVMRPAPGKSTALVLDHAGCVAQLGPPGMDREWSLEGAAKKRDNSAKNLRTCDTCSMIYEAEPKLFLDEVQPTLKAAFHTAVAGLLAGGVKGRGMDACPGCGTATCTACGAGFKPVFATRDIDGIATTKTTACPSCEAAYSDQAPKILSEPKETELPTTTQDLLQRMRDEIPLKVAVENEYKKLINQARAKGAKRGWAYWRLREKYDEATLRQCLPRHTANWWRASA